MRPRRCLFLLAVLLLFTVIAFPSVARAADPAITVTAPTAGIVLPGELTQQSTITWTLDAAP